MGDGRQSSASDNTCVVTNARLPMRSGMYQVAIAKGIVQSVEPMGVSVAKGEQIIDIANDWLSLGAVDLQINGALGLAFPDLRLGRLDKLQEICDFLWAQGVDGFCPTLVTTSLENFHGSLEAIATFRSKQTATDRTAKVLGVHLEGPCLNKEKRGAHPAEYLQPLTLETVESVVKEFASEVSIMTLAPEIATDLAAIDWLIERGITVSLGHSLCSAKQATQAFDRGASMVTHAFNAMPGLHHREPGLLGAAMTDPRAFCGFIADGQHINITMLDLLLRAGRGGLHKELDGLFLVSDALSPLGLPDGIYPWDAREIEVVNGTAMLADGTLSGTTLSLIAGAQNLVAWELCSVEEAISLVTQAPRRAVGLTQNAIAPGSPACFLRWHQNETVQPPSRKTALALTWQRLNLQ